MIMSSQGNSPENPTIETVQKAVDLVKEQKDKGQIRRFTGNDYADDLAAGNIVVAQAYSGDVVQLQADNPDLEFIIPESGGDWFIDTQVIPYTTQNQKAAEAWINYVYDRANYAKLVAFTQYVPVLSDMTDELNKIDPEAGGQSADQPDGGDEEQAQDLAGAHRRADPAVQHRVRRSHRQLAADGRSSQQQSPAQQGRAVPDDLAGAGVPRHLLRGAVLLAVPDVAVDDGRIDLPAQADVRVGLQQLRAGAHAVPGPDHPVAALRA